MKIYQVVYEKFPDDGKVVEVKEYVAANSLIDVADFYANQCEELQDNLVSVIYMLTVSSMIK